VNDRSWPAIVAHRGASARHPENTLSAFEAAVEAGVDFVELDVRRCVDGGLAVAHDPTFASDEGGSFAISDLSLAELKRLRPQTPSLDEVLELFRGRVALEVEIKNARGEPGYEPGGLTVARDVVAAIQRHDFADAFVASFDGPCLDSVKGCDPQIATGLLLEGSRDLARALETVVGRDAFLLPEAGALEAAGRPFVEHAHGRGIRICAWEVDDPSAIERLFELGADAVETNDPAVGVAVRDRIRSRRNGASSDGATWVS
jgi:glycerophosphoryl diester phosphodiesterase